MDVHDLDYPLPPEAIAQRPIEPRDAARLLVDRGPEVAVEHATVADLDRLLEPNDVLVVNDTRVLPARLALRKPTGGAVEVLLLERRPEGWWEALVRPGRRVRPGTRLRPAAGDRADLAELEVSVGEELGADGRRRVDLLLPNPGPSAPNRRRIDAEAGDSADWIAPNRRRIDAQALDSVGGAFAPNRRRIDADVLETDVPEGELAALASLGVVPLPPYVHEKLDDPERYQTVFAHRPGSVAAPTAGLHLTDELLDRCRARGIEVLAVELVVGLGTFRPITAERVEDHPMHAERYRIPPAAVARLGPRLVGSEAHARGRVVAVGTTVVRALESWAATGQVEGSTDLFIRPGFRFEVVDRLLTNFHVPRSSLLAMVEAFVGPRWRDRYRLALAEGYRFLSFGDAQLLDRLDPAPAEARQPRPDGATRS